MSSNENAVGRLMKTESYRDKTCAGRVMEAVGKSQTYASQQMSVYDYIIIRPLKRPG